jgi:hypothetical protein
MKAPFWAVCCVCALLSGSVYAADEADRSQNVGPTAAALGRPVSDIPDFSATPESSSRAATNFSAEANAGATVNSLRYPTVVTTPPSTTIPATGAISPTVAPPAQIAMPSNAPAPNNAATTPAPFASPDGVVPTAAEKKSSSRMSKVLSNPFKSTQLSSRPKEESKVAATPTVTTPSVAAPQTQEAQVGPWRPMQTAYRQLSNPPAVANSEPPINPVIAPNNPPPFVPPGRIPSQYGPAAPPSSVPQGGAVDLTKPTPLDPEYSNGETARLRRIEQYEALYGKMPGGAGGGGCNCGGGCPTCGSPGDSQICPNCGGWHHGTCLTNNPNGSCVCERLACCLTKPYPDCSNGCVDFCHSWVFHEDDCWLTSNKKCPGPGCGPYPYGSCPNDGMGKGNGCGCGNCGPCVPPNPIYFSAEGLVLTRDNQANNQVIAFNGLTPALSVGDFDDFDWKGGPSFVFGYRPTPMDLWELSYFGLQDWNETLSLGSDLSAISLPPTLGSLIGGPFDAIDILNVTYSSEIHDAEVNYFWHPDRKWLNWMVGFRYFQLDEQFNISAFEVEDLGVYNTRAVNNLYGGQLGCRAHFCTERCSFSLTGKAGAFGNSVQMQQQIGPEGFPIIRDTNVSQGYWAFVGQVGCSVTYNFARHWYVMGGYDALWLEGVALAPDQLDFSVLDPEAGTRINHNGSLFLHGAHAGIGFQW